MHIPDGYLSPQTYLPAFALMASFWGMGLRRLRSRLRLRQIPLLALGAAFSFVLMMFNIPIPGGTTGHAVGGVLVAILLGPWAASIAVSLALIVQALLFGDGGITAIGANCLTMGVVMPFVGYSIYQLLAGKTPSPKRRVLSGGIAGYFGLVAAAVCTGFLFGIQPLIAKDAAGQALYCPFGLSIALPVMALEHLLFFGFVEGIATALALSFLQKTNPEILREEPRFLAVTGAVLGLLILLSPLGLYLPERFGAGAAWGEWNSKEIKEEMLAKNRAPMVPQGIKRAEERGWKAILPDYALPGGNPYLAYILSGAIGVTALGSLILLSKGAFARHDG